MRALQRIPVPPKVCGALVGAAALASLSGCDLWPSERLGFPAALEGVPAVAPWTTLPLRAWVLEGEVRPEALAACLAPACEGRAAVAVFRATGTEAARLAAVLRDPDRLRRELEERRLAGHQARVALGRRRTPRAQETVEPWSEGEFSGFVVGFTRPDGARPAYGAVLATLRDPLRFVLAVAERADTARLRARTAAEANLR